MSPEEIIQYWETLLTEQVITPIAQMTESQVDGHYVFETPLAPTVRVILCKPL